MAIKDFRQLWRRYYQREYARRTRERRLLMKKIRLCLGVKSGALLLRDPAANDEDFEAATGQRS